MERRRSKLGKTITKFKEIYNKEYSVEQIIQDSIDTYSKTELLSITWRIYLNILPYNKTQEWLNLTSSLRQMYYKQYNEFISSNVLKFFNDELKLDELGFEKPILDNLHLIKIDVSRTFQEIDLFRNKKVKESLSHILFIWVSNNQDIGYMQGMNEILGTIYYALYPSCLSATNIATDEFCSLLYFLNSEDAYDADIFVIFSELMKRGLKDLYKYNHVKYKTSQYFEHISDYSKVSIETINKSNCSELKKRINTIFYHYLRFADLELFNHICNKVDPYLFMFRWILCMLNRELTLKNTIYVWDCIFVYEYKETTASLHFLDFMCISMLVSIKSELMQEDDSCYMLSLLMHYPTEIDIKLIIKNAILYREIVFDKLKIFDSN